MLLPRERLEAYFRAGLAAVDAGDAVRGVVTKGADGSLQLAGRALPDAAPLVVLAAGKGAVPMADALCEALPGRALRGLVVTKEGHGRAASGLETRESTHPVPDDRSEAAGRAALDLVASGAPGECLVVLLSGGASALLACPAPGLTLSDVSETTDLLLASGADIEAMNVVRKHLSAVGGGRLAQAWRGGPIFLLAVSDVPGDRLDVIGSGPCSADPSSFSDAWGVVEAFGLARALPERVRRHLEAGCRGEIDETPKRLAGAHAAVIASNERALAAVESAARADGLRVVRSREPLGGEAREAAARALSEARAAAREGPCLWLAGGETTVRLEVLEGLTLGRGGRNQELALAAARAIDGDGRVSLLAVGTDGTDGPTDAAGAFADGGTVARARALGRDASDALARHDAYAFFDAEGGLLRTGPTGTNVMDLLLISVD